jgi:hypothetical protein
MCLKQNELRSSAISAFSVNMLPTCPTVSLPWAKCQCTHNVTEATELTVSVWVWVVGKCIIEQLLWVKDRVTI